METIVFDAEMWQRFLAYGNTLAARLGNAARERGLSDDRTGLLLPGDRKSMESMAAQMATHPAEVPRRHQAIRHFTSEARWDDLTVRGKELLHLPC
jgi:SRSO17 transposase